MFFSFDSSLMMMAVGVFEKFKNEQGQLWGWNDTITVTLAGFFIVFLVLILLILIFTVFGKIMAKVNEKEAKKAKTAETVQPSGTAVGSGAADEETAAVITAAITEAVGGKKFIIKDIREANKK